MLYSVLFVESLQIFVNMSIGMKKIFFVHRVVIKACKYPAFYKEKNIFLDKMYSCYIIYGLFCTVIFFIALNYAVFDSIFCNHLYCGTASSQKLSLCMVL
jgi:hypothetical protein